MNIRAILVRLHWLLSSQVGIDPRKALRFLWGIPRFLRDALRFRGTYTGRFKMLPCVHDWYEEGGTTKSEYFWQDLLVARMIFEANPKKHIDVGSRVDGFVAHVASFREIEVFDVRPLTTRVPGMTFKQIDLMDPVEGMIDYCDSLSCLHALEHFGLGRYGDPINPEGHKRGLKNLADLLKRNGVLYLSIPIGLERVEFNAHRVFDPRAFVTLAMQHSLTLSALVVIQPDGTIERLAPDNAPLARLACEEYALGVFIFRKHPTSSQVKMT